MLNPHHCQDLNLSNDCSYKKFYTIFFRYRLSGGKLLVDAGEEN